MFKSYKYWWFIQITPSYLNHFLKWGTLSLNNNILHISSQILGARFSTEVATKSDGLKPQTYGLSDWHTHFFRTHVQMHTLTFITKSFILGHILIQTRKSNCTQIPHSNTHHITATITNLHLVFFFFFKLCIMLYTLTTFIRDLYKSPISHQNITTNLSLL